MRGLTTLLSLVALLFTTTATPANTAPKREKITSVITYTAIEKIDLPNNSSFDCKISSHKFDKESGEGTITFKGELRSMGTEAFINCTTLTSITLPKGVTTIGQSTFAGCSSLEKITWSEELTTIADSAFAGCHTLSEVNIGKSVTTIGNSAFAGCSSLRSITLPNNVKSIGSSAFASCSSLTRIIIPEGITTIREQTFSLCENLNSITLAKSITEIGDKAFYGCLRLTAIDVPEAVTKIGTEAFFGCKGLTKITLPDAISEVGYQAFGGCSNLTTITLPDTISKFGHNAFVGCNIKRITVSTITGDSKALAQRFGASKIAAYKGKYASADGHALVKESVLIDVVPQDITSYTIPEGVTKIGDRAFEGCSKLKSVTMPNTLVEIGIDAFKECNSLTEITIPSSVTMIDGGAFAYCSALASVTIHDTITMIGEAAFDGVEHIHVHITDLAKYCTANSSYLLPGTKHLYLNNEPLTEIVIPEGVIEVGSNAFADCIDITKVTIPSNVTTLGKGAFKNCCSLATLVVDDSMTVLDASAFENCTISQMHINISDLAKYCTANSSYLLPGTKHLYLNNEPLTELAIPEGVIEVGSNAFANCIDITKVTMPNSVTTLGEKAFKGSGIESITLSNKITAINEETFAICSNLKDITIPKGITTIGKSAFRGSGIASIIIPDNVTTLSESAFAECRELSSVELGLGLTEIGNMAFGNCENIINLTLGGNTLALLNSSLGNFDNVLNLTIIKGTEPFVASTDNFFSHIDELTIGRGFTTLDSSAFAGFPALNHIIIGDNTTTIAEGTFSECDNLKRIDLGAGIKSFNTGAIINCHSLENVVLNKNTKEIVIDDSVSYVRPYKYENTYNYYTADSFSYSLEDLSTLPGNIFYFDIFGESLKEVTLESIVLGKNTKAADSLPACNKVTIFRGLENFNSYPPESIYVDKLETLFEANWLWEAPCTFVHFYGCLANSNIYYLNGKLAIKKNPQSVTIPKGTKRIGNCTFAMCENLTSINIPEGVTSIGEYAFRNCEKLKSVTLPNSLVTIEDDAFCNTAIQSVTIPKNVTSIGFWAFWNDNAISMTLRNKYTSLENGCCNGTLYDASHLPMSKVTNANVAGVYRGKSVIDGKTVTTPLLLFDNGTYLKTRLDTYWEQYYEVGRYKISGTNIILTVAGHCNLNNEFRRISGSETLSVNTKTGTVGNYGKKRRLWRSNSEYQTVTKCEDDDPSNGEYTESTFYNLKNSTSWILNELNHNVKVSL